jgi:hypothetical protein
MLLITDLPDIMQGQNWPVAAACMRRWFNGPAWTLPQNVKIGATPMADLPAYALETGILKMDWALGFDRVKTAHQRLTSGLWNDAKALQQLSARVLNQANSGAGKGKKDGESWSFGDLTQPVKYLAGTAQTNFLTVGALNDPLDDFYGAVGKGSLDVVVSGNVVRQKTGRFVITVTSLGVYLRDTYDFNGDQPLGVWTQGGIDRTTFDQIVNADVWKYPPIALVPPPPPRPGVKRPPLAPDDPTAKFSVANSDFNKYRSLTGKGGDFVNISDLKITQLRTPAVIELP